MEDMSLTLSNKESVGVGFYQGKQYGKVFIWKQGEHHLSISIMVNETELFVVDLMHACSEINIRKQP